MALIGDRLITSYVWRRQQELRLNPSFATHVFKVVAFENAWFIGLALLRDTSFPYVLSRAYMSVTML